MPSSAARLTAPPGKRPGPTSSIARRGGETPRLTLDIYLQRLAQRLLGDRAGAVVLPDAWTGEVLAMASSPTFDPARLEEEWDRLRGDPGAPLLNRAVQGGLSSRGRRWRRPSWPAAALERGLDFPLTPPALNLDRDGGCQRGGGGAAGEEPLPGRTDGRRAPAGAPRPLCRPWGTRWGRTALRDAFLRWGLDGSGWAPEAGPGGRCDRSLRLNLSPPGDPDALSGRLPVPSGTRRARPSARGQMEPSPAPDGAGRAATLANDGVRPALQASAGGGGRIGCLACGRAPACSASGPFPRPGSYGPFRLGTGHGESGGAPGKRGGGGEGDAPCVVPGHRARRGAPLRRRRPAGARAGPEGCPADGAADAGGRYGAVGIFPGSLNFIGNRTRINADGRGFLRLNTCALCLPNPISDEVYLLRQATLQFSQFSATILSPMSAWAAWIPPWLREWAQQYLLPFLKVQIRELLWVFLQGVLETLLLFALPATAVVGSQKVWEGRYRLTPAQQETVARWAQVADAVARLEDVPPVTPLVLWYKEGGLRAVNPDNCEGIMGLHSAVRSGRLPCFPPGPIDDAEVARQLRLGARIFKEHCPEVHYTTTDPETLKRCYLFYNAGRNTRLNPDQSGYVMNGYDAAHQNMPHRTASGQVVRLQALGGLARPSGGSGPSWPSVPPSVCPLSCCRWRGWRRRSGPSVGLGISTALVDPPPGIRLPLRPAGRG